MSDRRRYQRAHPRQGRSVRNRLEDQHEGSNDYDLTANQTYALGTDDSAELADEDHGFPHQMNTPLATFYSPAQVENDDQSMEESATVWQNYSHSGARFDAHYTTSWSFMTPRTSAWDFAPHGHSAGGYLQPFVNEPDSLEGSGDGNGREAPESGGSFSSNEAEQGSVVDGYGGRRGTDRRMTPTQREDAVHRHNPDGPIGSRGFASRETLENNVRQYGNTIYQAQPSSSSSKDKHKKVKEKRSRQS